VTTLKTGDTGHDDDGTAFVYENGHKRRLNLKPPTGHALKLLQALPRAEDVIPLVSEDDWPRYWSLEAYTDDIDLDQGNVGSCAWEATAYCFMVARRRSGLLHVLVNPWTGYARTNNSDSGSDPAENFDYAQRFGFIPDVQWPRAQHSWRQLPSNADALAAPYRIDEYFRVRTWAELGSCVVQGIPVNVGVNWSGGGHAIIVVRMFPTGALIKNSWGNDWDGGYEKTGYKLLPKSQIVTGLKVYSCVACRSVVASDAPAAGSAA
jgi:hypothetical protein